MLSVINLNYNALWALCYNFGGRGRSSAMPVSTVLFKNYGENSEGVKGPHPKITFFYFWSKFNLFIDSLSKSLF